MARYFRVEPYPDEEIGSLLTRSMRRTGLSSREFVRWYLDRPPVPLTALGNVVPLVADFIDSTPRQVLREHTVVPYATAALPPRESRRILIDLTSGRLPKTIRSLGRLTRRWCEVCQRRELNLYGETYWHRSHLLPGVIACITHGTCLLQATGPVAAVPVPKAVTYWLRDDLPHELAGQPVGVTLAPGLAHQVSHWSSRALKGRQALPAADLSPSNWRKVFTPDFLQYAGCRDGATAHMPQTTARILSVIAERRLARQGTATQLELFF